MGDSKKVRAFLRELRSLPPIPESELHRDNPISIRTFFEAARPEIEAEKAKRHRRQPRKM